MLWACNASRRFALLVRAHAITLKMLPITLSRIMYIVRTM
jgi:hypothetical protein